MNLYKNIKNNFLLLPIISIIGLIIVGFFDVDSTNNIYSKDINLIPDYIEIISLICFILEVFTLVFIYFNGNKLKLLYLGSVILGAFVEYNWPTSLGVNIYLNFIAFVLKMLYIYSTSIIIYFLFKKTNKDI